MSALADILRLSQAIRRRGYVPRRLWRLYREVMGDHGVCRHNGRPRKKCCPKERGDRMPVSVATNPPRYGVCHACGANLTRGYTCGVCGENSRAYNYKAHAKEENK